MYKGAIGLVCGVLILAAAIPAGAVGPAKSVSDQENLVRMKFERETKLKLEELKLKKAENREEIKKKLKGLKDERKLLLAQKVSTRVCEAQANRVEKLKEHLQKMSEILDRLEKKAAELEKSGKDISGIKKEVSEARIAIESARTAVLAFADRDCGLTLSGSESQLKSELASAIKSLEARFKSLQTKLTEARKATAEAIRALAVLNNEGVR